MIPREILENVRRIEIKTRSIVEEILSGEYHSAFKGQGMEFSEVRTYVEGDDIRNIDWNVTARAGEPYVKKYIEERELTVMLVVDASASGSFGSVRRMKAEIAVELCALLAFSAIKNNDRVGLIMFTSEVEKFVPPKKGRNHVLRLIRELLCFTPARRGTDITDAIGFLNGVQRKRAVVFLVSDFISSGYEDAFRVAAKRHDMIAVSISDPRENEMPDIGLVDLRDQETGESVLVDSGSRAFREHFHRDSNARQANLATLLRSTGIDQIRITTATDYVEPLICFFKKREMSLARHA